MALSVKRIGTWSGHRDSVYDLALGIAPGTFISCGGDGMIVRWDMEKPDLGEVLATVSTSIYSLARHPDSSLITLGQNFDGVHVVDVETKKPVSSLKLTDQAIFAIAHIGEDETWVGTANGELIITDRLAKKILYRAMLGNERLRAITWHSSTGTVAIAGSDNSIRILDAASKKVVREFPAHDNSIFAMTYSPEEDLLLSVGRDARIRIWNAEKEYHPKLPIVAHMYAINHIAYSPSGRYFATCSMDKTVKIWCGYTFNLLKVLDKSRHAGHGTSVNRLLWLETDEFLVSCSDDRTLSVWHLENEIDQKQ